MLIFVFLDLAEEKPYLFLSQDIQFGGDARCRLARRLSLLQGQSGTAKKAHQARRAGFDGCRRKLLAT